MAKVKGFAKRILGLPKKYLIGGGLVILLILFFVVRGHNKPQTLQFATVSKNDISSNVSASGILNGKTSAALHFNAAGKLNYLAVSNGENVVRGETIATLDSTEANAAYQEALNNRRNTQAIVDNIHDQVKDHSGDETFAEKATRTTAEVANDNAYDSVLAAQQALRDTTLSSPISGIVVAQNNITPGQNVTPSDLIAQVVDFSEKDFDATVDESDIGSVQMGQNAQVTLNAYGNTVFDGVVVEIEPTTQTDSTGAITVTVKIQLTDPRIQNIFGLNGNATIITNSKKGVLTIPQDALIDDTHVYVKLANGKTEKHEIQTGIKSDTDVEVTSGLTEGEQVVTNPSAVK